MTLNRNDYIEAAKARARELGWQDFEVSDEGTVVTMLLSAPSATEQIVEASLSKLRKAIGDIGGPEDYAPVEEYDVVVEEYGEHQADTEMVWFYFLHAVEVALEYEAAKAMGAWIAFMVRDVEQKDANVKAYLEAHQAEWEAHEAEECNCVLPEQSCKVCETAAVEAGLKEVREHLDEEKAAKEAWQATVKAGDNVRDEPCHMSFEGFEIKPHGYNAWHAHQKRQQTVTPPPPAGLVDTHHGGDSVRMQQLWRVLTGQEQASDLAIPHPEQLVEALEKAPEVVVTHRFEFTDPKGKNRYRPIVGRHGVAREELKRELVTAFGANARNVYRTVRVRRV